MNEGFSFYDPRKPDDRTDTDLIALRMILRVIYVCVYLCTHNKQDGLSRSRKLTFCLGTGPWFCMTIKSEMTGCMNASNSCPLFWNTNGTALSYKAAFIWSKIWSQTWLTCYWALVQEISKKYKCKFNKILIKLDQKPSQVSKSSTFV